MSPYTTPRAASAIGAKWPRGGTSSAAPVIFAIISLYPDIRLLDHGAPFLHFGVQERGESIGRRAGHHRAAFLELRPDRRIRRPRNRGGRDLPDDLDGCLCRNKQSSPRPDLHTGNTRLRHGRTSGAIASRSALGVASTRSAPWRASGRLDEAKLIITSTRPGMRSLKASPAPR